MNSSAEPLEKELTFTRFDRMSEVYPNRPAVMYLGETFSYRRLRELSERFAGGLVDLGVKKGDRVMIYIPNCIQWIIGFWPFRKSELCWFDFPDLHLLRDRVHDQGCRGRDGDLPGHELLLCQRGPADHRSQAHHCDEPRGPPFSLEKISGCSFRQNPNGKVERDSQVLWFRSLLKHSPLREKAELDPWKDLSYILYTGGPPASQRGSR